MCLSRSEFKFGFPSARVKCIDFHESNPLLVAALFSGSALVVDTNTGSVVKTYNVHEGSALRTCRWIHKTGNFVAGGDKSALYFYSYTKNKLVLTVPDASVGPVRSIAVHPTENLILSCGDDKLVKLWDISNDECKLIRTFSAHSALVIDVKWSIREPTNFASCSYDGTVVFWEISTENPMFTQKISNKCVNCISFASVGEKSYFAASTDDYTVYIIDVQTRSVVTKLEDHTNNVSRVEFHNFRPILFTVSEDSTAISWSSTTFKKENTIKSTYKRMWSLAFSPCMPLLAIGCDDGLCVYKFTNEGIPISMDSSGKIIASHVNDIVSANLREFQKNADNSEIPVQYKEAVTTEFIPEYVNHSPNGKFVSICGSGEYTIYSTLGFRAKAYGKAEMVAWSHNSTDFAVLNNNGEVEVHIGSDEPILIKNYYSVRIFGGYLLGIQDSSSLTFIDWISNHVIRRIDVDAIDVAWDGYRRVAVRTKEQIFVLNYNEDHNVLESEETGFTDSFEVLQTYETPSTSFAWASGVLIFTNDSFVYRCVSGIFVVNSKHLKQVVIVGYLPKENNLILADHRGNLISANLPNSLLQFESLVTDDFIDEAVEFASNIPDVFRAKESRVMRQLGQRKLALSVAKDKNSLFEIASEIGEIEEMAKNATDESQFKKLAKMALEKGNYEIAVDSLKKCKDFSSLLILLKGRGDTEGIKSLVDEAATNGQLNVAFSAALLIGDKKRCVELLLQSKMYPEAALLARSSVPEMVSECVKQWKENAISKRIADSLADPAEFPDLFE